MTEKPAFFTWIEATYTDKADVPARLVMELKLLKHFGASSAELAEIFNMQEAWVEEFTSDVEARDKVIN